MSKAKKRRSPLQYYRWICYVHYIRKKEELNEIFSHIEEDSGEQTLKEHLINVADLSAEFAKSFDCYDWGYCCGMLHDIGNIPRNFSNAWQAAIYVLTILPLEQNYAMKQAACMAFLVTV